MCSARRTKVFACPRAMDPHAHGRRRPGRQKINEVRNCAQELELSTSHGHDQRPPKRASRFGQATGSAMSAAQYRPL